jgi:hypothetical protein
MALWLSTIRGETIPGYKPNSCRLPVDLFVSAGIGDSPVSLASIHQFHLPAGTPTPRHVPRSASRKDRPGRGAGSFVAFNCGMAGTAARQAALPVQDT